MTGELREAIKEREAVEHPTGESVDHEAWRVQYVQDAYTDQLGMSHSAWVVYERTIVHVTAKAEQFEYYGQKWYLSDLIGTDDEGRKFRYRANLVDYHGGGSWILLNAVSQPGIEVKGYWRMPPWAPEGEAPKGYMLPDGTPATKLLG